jgi:hypothetical protein
VPFKPGDILFTHGFEKDDNGESNVFILESFRYWEHGSKGKEWNMLRRDMFDLSDSVQIMEVNDAGVLSRNDGGMIFNFEYYRGKLEGKRKLLHYVNLYMQGKIRLVELLTVQGKIIAENLLDFTRIDAHFCEISEHLLAENRLSPEEEEKVNKGEELAPWVVRNLSKIHVEFLVKEMGLSALEVQTKLSAQKRYLLSACAKIMREENNYEKTGDGRFNYYRRAMAESVRESYGYKSN